MSCRVEVKWDGAAVEAEVKDAIADGLFAAAEFLLEEANRTCPHDTGDLEKSGETDVDRGAGEASVSYDRPYAKYVHEGERMHFQKNRRAKWLELTLREQMKAVKSVLYEIMNKALGG